MNWKPRKFLNYAQGWHSGSHVYAWAAITTFVRKGFPRTSNLERSIAVPRFFFIYNKLLGNKKRYAYMKKSLAILIMILGVLSGYSQETYDVISKSTYNIRSAPNTDAAIIGSTYNKSSIDVFEIKDGWAKIKYENDTAYVKSDCLGKMPQKIIQQEKLSRNKIIEDTKWILFVFFCLAIFLVIVMLKRSHSEFLSDSLYKANLITFNFLCLLEWFYILKVGENFLWFFNPEIVGGMVFVNALFFGFIAISQTLAFYYTMTDFRKRYDANFHLHIGIWSLPGLIVFSILAGSLWGIEAILVVILVFFLCQIFQVVFIFTRMLRTGGWLPSLIASYTYIVGFVTSLLVASIFFIVILLIFFMKNLMSSMLSAGAHEQRYYY